jgi:hypothetical protein
MSERQAKAWNGFADHYNSSIENRNLDRSDLEKWMKLDQAKLTAPIIEMVTAPQANTSTQNSVRQGRFRIFRRSIQTHG